MSATASSLFVEKAEKSNNQRPVVSPPPKPSAAEVQSYRGKINYTEKKSREYQNRGQGKNRAELRLVERAFRLIPSGKVLDAPCGGGRVSVLLSELGHELTAADSSESMLAIARENFAREGLNIPVMAEDVEKLSYPDQRFDTVICFRLFHHFPEPAIRQKVVKELSRVARRFVALSYFSPYSVTSLQRRWRTIRTGRLPRKRATPLSEVEQYFQAAGFRLVKNFAQLPYVHTLHLAIFERKD